MLIDFYKKTWHRIILENKLTQNSYLIKDTILDIGSKNRRYDHMFKGKIIAIDKETNNSKNIISGDIEEKLNFSNESFDSIICIEVLEYVKNTDNAIKEIYRILKSGGWAIITIPFLYHDHNDKIRFTKQAILEHLDNFSEIHIENIGNGHTVIWDIIRKKLIINKRGIVRKALFLLLTPYLLTLKLIKIEKIEDSYYSGLFIKLKK